MGWATATVLVSTSVYEKVGYIDATLRNTAAGGVKRREGLSAGFHLDCMHANRGNK